VNRASKALLIGFALCALATTAAAQEPPAMGGGSIFDALQSALDRDNVPTTLAVVVIVTIIALAPSILVMTTSFTRIIVVLGFLRQALATQQTPPNQVLVGLALFLTFFVMAPTYMEINEEAIQPYLRGEMESPSEAFAAAMAPMRDFMFRQTRPKDLKVFLDIGDYPRPETPDDVPTHVLIPAFVISEMAIAFQIGFIIYIPFLIIDMVVASTLMAMGMMMLPPIFVSLPFKIIMFVLADGWNLMIGSLVRSFG
jgi:flagellar biosynthetic protein FliP